MIRPGIVFGLAKAEARLTRRLVRYWLFLGLSLLMGVVFFLYYAWIHRAFSSWSGTAALLNPRYLLGFVGIYYLVGFLLALVFLGYDLRARDSRERMAEVLDSQPFTNLELLFGKFVGILIPSWIPVLLIAGVLALIGQLLGAPIQLHTVVTFVLLMAIPAYCFVLGLTFLLTLVLRHRLLAAVIIIGMIVGLITVNFAFVPIYLLPLVDITGGFANPSPSDLVPVFTDLRGLFQRTGILLAGIAMVFLAAAIHPRRDDSNRSLTAIVGVALLVVGLGICGWLVLGSKQVIDQRIAWKQIHETRKSDPAPDLLALIGEVSLDPGGAMNLTATLRFRAPSDASLNSALFSLNPGMQVSSIVDSAGANLEFEHADGLLEIDLAAPLGPGQESELTLRTEGVPHRWFAYLDAVIDPLAVNIRDGNIFLLGLESIINDRRFMVLLPATRWLPASGAEIGRGDPRVRPDDFFEIDLTVEVPESWLVAGPGRRGDAEGSTPAGRKRFRFHPPAPVPDVALVAGPLVSRSAEVQGILLEALVSPAHEASLEFFSDAAVEIRDWMDQRLQDAADAGLDYPYDALTLVEIPSAVRGYAGGWRMDTTFTQPAMVLMRESGFPTARFDTRFKDPDDWKDHEGGIPRAKREVLEKFFENDFSGGNPFIAAARSFFSFQTAGSGAAGLPLDYVCEDLSTKLVTDKQGYFSIHHYGRDMGTTINQTIGSMFRGGGDVSDALIDTVTSRTEVWDAVLEKSLEELNPWDAPKRALDVLTLKGGAMSRSMIDDLGREKTAELLGALRETKRGGQFSRDDLLAAGDSIGLDLTDWLDVWISSTSLPGFLVGKSSVERISDSEDGTARYQVRVTIYNGEATPGLVKLEYFTGEPGRRGGPGRRPKPEASEPLRVDGNSAVELGLVTSEPPRRLRLVPYLALNRVSFGIDLPALDEEEIVKAEPFVGVRETDWKPRQEDAIVVDDLDEGFSVIDDASGAGLRFAGRGLEDQDTDQGLPVAQFGRPSPSWSRRSQGDAYGKYRHTHAIVRAGKGEKRAVFAAEIPRAGEWELEYYFAGRPRRGQSSRFKPGTWSLKVIDPSGEHEVVFNAEDAANGWNSLGAFDIADGETRVEILDSSDGGRYVIADAVRWTRASAPATVEGKP